MSDDVLCKFFLYSTTSRYYLVGQSKSAWHVLKFDRHATTLEVVEDPTPYTQRQASQLLQQIHAGNQSTGGLRLVAKAYGILGCFRFLEGYYLLLVSKRRYVGSIAGHKVYGIADKGLVQLTRPPRGAGGRDAAAERRYRRLLLTGLDLTKDFYFSYTYNLSQSLQANFARAARVDDGVHQDAAERFAGMFVWNEYLSRPLRTALGGDRWLLSVMHGFFEQKMLSLFGRALALTLISRRSKHFAGTRYRKRGVNDEGHVANEVETEQLVLVDNPLPGEPPSMASCVQLRGSIPLYWSQEGSTKLKPDIVVQRYDPLYKATRAHFGHLQARYGSPVVVLDMVKQVEKRPRETLLSTEFCAAVAYANGMLPASQRLRYCSYDLHRAAKRRDVDVLGDLQPLMSRVVADLGQFVYVPPLPKSPACEDTSISLRMQHGVLRTNCIDCLDRTNVGQFVYGLTALAAQLAALGLLEHGAVDRNSSLARQLMDLYEAAGHTLAMQYGGSEAHSSFFQRARGGWEAATTSRDFVTSLRRYYSNTYTDAEKQDAINLFLGNFQPAPGKAHLWELDSDNFLHSGRGRTNPNTSPSNDGGSTRQPSGFFDLQAHQQLPEPAAPPTPGPLDHTPAPSFSATLPEEPPEPPPPALTMRTSAQAVAAWLQQDAGSEADEGPSTALDDDAGSQRPDGVVAVSVSVSAAAAQAPTSTPPGSPQQDTSPQQDISPQSTLRSARSSSSDLWAAFSGAQGGAPVTGGSGRRLKLESFDKVLGRQAIVSQRTGVFEAQTPNKAYLPQWLASPLGMTWRPPPSTTPAPPPPPPPLPPPPATVQSPQRPSAPLRRTNSDSKLQDLLNDAWWSGDVGQHGGQTLSRASSATDAVLSMASLTGTLTTVPTVKRSHTTMSGLDTSDMVLFAACGLPQPSARSMHASRRRMPAFAKFRQPSRTLAAMHLDAPRRSKAPGSTAGQQEPPGAPPVAPAATTPDIANLLDGPAGVRAGRETLGVPPELRSWWGVGQQEGWSTMQQEADVRALYTQYLDSATSLTRSQQQLEQLTAWYEAAVSPVLVLSSDGFAEGAGRAWRRSAGLQGMHTATERELRSIAAMAMTAS